MTGNYRKNVRQPTRALGTKIRPIVRMQIADKSEMLSPREHLHDFPSEALTGVGSFLDLDYQILQIFLIALYFFREKCLLLTK